MAGKTAPEKAAPAKKTATKKATKGDSIVCEECGFTVVVEEVGGLAVAEETSMICCGKPMKTRASKPKAAKK